MAHKNECLPLKEQPQLPAYDTFKGSLRQVMSVPKSEIDKREAEYQKQQQKKKQTKKAGANRLFQRPFKPA